jgi:hypothetical protein
MLKRQGHNHHNYTVPTTDSKRRQAQHSEVLRVWCGGHVLPVHAGGAHPSQCWLHPPLDALTRCLSTSPTSSSPCAPSFPTARTLKDERRWWHQAVKETEHVQHDLQWFTMIQEVFVMPYAALWCLMDLWLWLKVEKDCDWKMVKLTWFFGIQGSIGIGFFPWLYEWSRMK